MKEHKTMKKSDRELQHDVMAELDEDPSIDPADIGVAVYDGVVTLSGLVKTFAEKMAAEKAVRRVAGVRALAEHLKVRWSSDPQPTDEQIAASIADTLAWNVSVPDGSIDVKVEGGIVTLNGEVDWYYQRDEARRVAGMVKGVLNVSDVITVKALPNANNIKERIVHAIKRQADEDAHSITVRTEGGKVILGGTVKAWSDRPSGRTGREGRHGRERSGR
jgi:osmotically-inducible protein OsmY